MIYLDNAATTFPKPPEVEHAVMAAFHTIGNAGRGAHAATLDASRIIYGTRERLAELFHAEDASRIAFTANVTESLNIAIQGLFEPGDHVITSVCEHNSVLRPLYLMEQRGVKVTYLPADSKGRIAYDELENAYEPETKAVVIMHASNLTGNVTDLEQIAAFTQKHHLLFVVDAAQTAGVLPTDGQKQNIDVLCFTGHKGLFGPQGTGGIYVRKGVEIRPLFAGGTGVQSYSRTQPKEMPALLEAGTLNGHGIAGLYAALGYLQKTGIDKIYGREMALAERFYNGVKDISGVKIYGDFTTKNRVAVVTLNIGDIDSGSVSDWLWEDYEIAVRAGAQRGLVRGEGGVVQIVDGDLVEFGFRRHGEPDGVHERFGIFRAAHERAGRLPRGGIGGAEDAAIAGQVDFVAFFHCVFLLSLRTGSVSVYTLYGCERGELQPRRKIFCKTSRPAKQDGPFRISGFQFMRQPHWPQKTVPGFTGAPHCGQTTAAGSSGVLPVFPSAP